MPVLGTYIVGLFPPSRELVTLGMDIGKGREPAEKWDPAVNRYVNDLLDFQERTGTVFYSDGGIMFEDIYRPLARMLQGISLPDEGMADMSPFPRQNYYYLKPKMESSELRCENPRDILQYIRLFQLFPVDGKVTLPGIYSFVAAASVDRYRDNTEKAMYSYAEALAEIAKVLADDGMRLIELDESLYVNTRNVAKTHVNTQLLEAERRGVEKVRDAVSSYGTQVAVNLGYGDSARIVQGMPDGVIYHVNALETPADQLRGRLRDNAVAIGVADNLMPARTEVESVEMLKERAERFMSARGMGDRDFYLVSNNHFVNLPYDIAMEKQRNLAQAARELAA